MTEHPDHVALAELHLARAERYLKLARDHDVRRFDAAAASVDGDAAEADDE